MRRPLHKLLKTWQLLASCEGGPSPSWQWHLNCPALAQWGSPHPPLHTQPHTQLLNHTHFSCGSERTDTMTRSGLGYFLVCHRCKLAHLLAVSPPNSQFLTQFPHPSRAKQTTQFSFSLTHTHTHTHRADAVMYSGLSLQVTWPLLFPVSARWQQSRIVPNTRAELMHSFSRCFSRPDNGGRMNPTSILGGVHKGRA